MNLDGLYRMQGMLFSLMILGAFLKKKGIITDEGKRVIAELVVRDISKNVVRLPLNPPMERVLGVRIPSAKKASPAASLLIAQLQRTVFELEGPLL